MAFDCVVSWLVKHFFFYCTGISVFTAFDHCSPILNFSSVSALGGLDFSLLLGDNNSISSHPSIRYLV